MGAQWVSLLPLEPLRCGFHCLSLAGFHFHGAPVVPIGLAKSCFLRRTKADPISHRAPVIAVVTVMTVVSDLKSNQSGW